MDSSNDDFIGGLRRGEMASSHFTIVANLVARDRNLSCAAKGLFLNMASHKVGFVITEEFLASQCSDGVKVIRRLLVELRDNGYVYRSEKRTRYPAGTVSAEGKRIGGALGPYAWWVTDKPEEVAVILARHAQEQRAANLDADIEAQAPETAGQNNLPKRPVVATSGNAEPPGDRSGANLPPKTAGSSDQAKQGETAGRNQRPIPTGGFGSSLEDQPKKTNNKNTGGTLPPDPLRTQPPSGSVPVLPAAPSVATSNGGREQGDHKRADVRVHVDPHMGDGSRNVTQLAKVLSMANRRLSHPAATVRAYRLLMDATSRATLEAVARELVQAGTSPQEAPDAAFRQQIETVFTAAAEEGRLGKVIFEWPPSRPKVEPVNQLDKQRADRVGKIRQQAGVPRGIHYARRLGDAG